MRNLTWYFPPHLPVIAPPRETLVLLKAVLEEVCGRSYSHHTLNKWLFTFQLLISVSLQRDFSRDDLEAAEQQPLCKYTSSNVFISMTGWRNLQPFHINVSSKSK